MYIDAILAPTMEKYAVTFSTQSSIFNRNPTVDLLSFAFVCSGMATLYCEFIVLFSNGERIRALSGVSGTMRKSSPWTQIH